MKVRELIERLKEMPQELEAVIYDADEGALLRLDAYMIEHKMPDKPYKDYPMHYFERVEIGADYDDRRIERTLLPPGDSSLDK